MLGLRGEEPSGCGRKFPASFVGMSSLSRIDGCRGTVLRVLCCWSVRDVVTKRGREDAGCEDMHSIDPVIILDSRLT